MRGQSYSSSYGLVCTVLYCVDLYYILYCCIVMYFTVLYFTVLYWLYYTILYFVWIVGGLAARSSYRHACTIRARPIDGSDISLYKAGFSQATHLAREVG